MQSFHCVFITSLGAGCKCGFDWDFSYLYSHSTELSYLHWVQAARALANMAQSLKDEMPPENAQPVADTLCQQLPGRLWEVRPGLFLQAERRL